MTIQQLFALIPANLRLYSVQAIVFLASLNTLYLSVPALFGWVPPWIVGVLNVAALLYGYIGRGIPQPEAAAKIEAIKAAV